MGVACAVAARQAGEHSTVSVEAYLKGTAALISLAFAFAILASGARRSPQRYLATFLVLIALNQGADMMYALRPGSVAWQVRWYQIGTVFAALDPLVLYYFASIYPQRNALNRALPLSLVTAGAAACALGAPWMRPEGHSLNAPLEAWLQAGLTTYTAGVYFVVLAAALRGAARHAREPAARVLVPAMAVAALPLAPRVVYHVWRPFMAAYPELGSQSASLAVESAMEVGAAVGAAWLMYRFAMPEGASAPVRRTAVTWLALGTVIGLSLRAANIMTVPTRWGFPTPTDVLLDFGRVGLALRWLVFGAAVSAALLRHSLFVTDLRARRRAARVLVGSTFLVLAAVLIGTLDGLVGLDLRPVELVLVGLLLVASQGFRSLLDQVAWKLYAVPLPGDVVGRQEAYRHAAEQVVRNGRSPAGDAALQRLRAELGLDPAAAETLDRVAETAVSTPLAPGQVVHGRYRVDRLLGRGGSGRAFLAHDALLDRHVVLKEVLHDADAATALREARVAGALESPHVVTVHDVIPRSESSLLVTEYVAGGTLAERAQREGPLAAAEGLRLVEAILEGLASVHARGVVHRDLKPANVLLTSSGRPKIADFGLARLRTGQTTMAPGAWQAEGTPAFMAPEQLRGEAATPATDVYAVGLLARRCIAQPLPPDAEAIVARALWPEPRTRWRDAGEMLAALRGSVGPVREERAPDADDVPVAQRAGFAGRERDEVDARPVAAVGEVLDDVRAVPPDDAAVLAADVGVEVEGDRDAATPADEPLVARRRLRRRP